MNKAPAYLIQGNNITIVINNKPHTINKTHPTYEKVKEAIKTGQWDVVCNIIDPKKMVLNYGAGKLSVQGEKLFWNGVEFHNAMSKRMFQMLQEDLPIEPLVLFMENLMDNPSYRAVNELFGFLEKNNLPITSDGHFLAYKKVRENYKDVHSGTFDNSVGQTVTMERNQVNDNKEETCSAGLHFCSLGYLNHFGGERVVIVKINPRDVVSIPSDYNATKGRACRYEVIEEINKEQLNAIYQIQLNNENLIIKHIGNGSHVPDFIIKESFGKNIGVFVVQEIWSVPMTTPDSMNDKQMFTSRFVRRNLNNALSYVFYKWSNT